MIYLCLIVYEPRSHYGEPKRFFDFNISNDKRKTINYKLKNTQFQYLCVYMCGKVFLILYKYKVK